jgi:methyl-accepting chemotaxis protein
MNLSLTQRLVFGGLVLVTIPVVTVAVLAYRNASNSLSAAAGERLRDRASDTAYGLDQQLRGELLIVGAIARNDVLQNDFATVEGGDGAAALAPLRAELKDIMAALGDRYAGLFVADLTGRVVAGTTQAGDTTPYDKMNVADRDYFRDCLRLNAATLGAANRSKSTNEAIVAMGAPISAGGRVVGMVGVTLRLKSLSETIAGHKVGTTGYAYIATNDGLVVAHPKPEHILNLNMKTLAGMEAITRRMTGGETGVEKNVFMGVAKTSGFAPVKLNAWSVCFTQNDDEFMAPARQFAQFAATLSGVLLLLAAAACVWFGRRTARPLQRISKDMSESAHVVDDSAQQVSSAAQGLAHSASAQASALEETSSSIEELSSMARQNAAHSTEATKFMAETRGMVETANSGMKLAAAAMEGVAKASNETAAIIKTIDEIAFQTNILALNAAVEAARAGEAGAGFAVVAEEVRALATRSAEASRNTAQLIETTRARVKDAGTQVSACGEAFAGIAANTQKIDKLLTEVATASQEQNLGISEINKATAQMDQMVQSNAAAAEEASAASEELAGQAQMMRAGAAELFHLVAGSESMAIVAASGAPGSTEAAAAKRPTAAGTRAAIARTH